MPQVNTETTRRSTSAKELKLRFEAIGSIRAFICSQASKTAAPYISELAEAAVGDELGTYSAAMLHKYNKNSIF